jgi:DNA-binding MarR family transcriptional regulator
MDSILRFAIVFPLYRSPYPIEIAESRSLAMLSEIKQLLAQHGQLTLRELAVHFQSEADALEPMLQRLIDKGQVKRIEAGCGGSPCSGCASACRADMLAYKLT